MSLLLGLYAFLLMWCAVILLTTGTDRNVAGGTPTVSVVVACRNEAGRIDALVEQLVPQVREVHGQLILVDDHSEDGTLDKMKQHGGRPEVRVITLPQGQSGKKAALTAGIAAAEHPVIVTTDADCKPDAGWLRGVAEAFQQPKTQFVIGTVRIGRDKGWFSRWQAMEFASLSGVTAVAQWFRHPVMCNGANLAFRKRAFREVDGYQGNQHLPSGDDEFLMRKMYARFPEGIAWLSSLAQVQTEPATDIRSFFHQRLRWASKWKANSDGWAKMVGLLVWVLQTFSLPVMLWAGWRAGASAALVMGGVKVGMEGIFLFSAHQRNRQSFDFPAFVLCACTYPIYVAIVGIASWGWPYQWKNRIYSR